MIRARVYDGGALGWVFGLSRKNIDLLQEGKPIMFDFGELGGPAGTHIVIMFGETEDAIAEELQRGFGEAMEMRDRREKK